LVAGTFTGQRILYSADSGIGIDSRSNVTVVIDATGLRSYTAASIEAPERGTNGSFETGTDGVLSWTRWAGGTTAGTYFTTPGQTRSSNQGWHLIWGTPVTTIPTTGTVNYNLAGFTAPTVSDGSLAPGTFTGKVAVAFSSAPSVGLELAVTIGGITYAGQTIGGVANPTQSGAIVITSGAPTGVFNVGFATTGTGPICRTGRCNMTVRGTLAGAGAQSLGIAYVLSTSVPGEAAPQVRGTAAFNTTAAQQLTTIPAGLAGKGDWGTWSDDAASFRALTTIQTGVSFPSASGVPTEAGVPHAGANDH